MGNNKNNTKNVLSRNVIISVAAVLVVTTILGFLFTGNNNSNSGNTVMFKDSDITINLSDVSETAKFYPAEIDGTKLEVIAVKAPDGTIRTAFNTCQVCYDSGRGYYKQDGNQLVCQNCGNRFGMGDVEVSRGGCNPVPITSENKTVDETSITISKAFLSEAKQIFDNWKN